MVKFQNFRLKFTYGNIFFFDKFCKQTNLIIDKKLIPTFSQNDRWYLYFWEGFKFIVNYIIPDFRERFMMSENWFSSSETYSRDVWLIALFSCLHSLLDVQNWIYSVSDVWFRIRRISVSVATCRAFKTFTKINTVILNCN